MLHLLLRNRKAVAKPDKRPLTSRSRTLDQHRPTLNQHRPTEGRDPNLLGQSQAGRDIQPGDQPQRGHPAEAKAAESRPSDKFMAVTHPGFGPPTLTSSRASLQRPGTYLTHRRAELRVARALRDLQCSIPELRVLPAPVKQVHRPTAVDVAIPSRPLGEAAGILGALRCHVGGKREDLAALGRASRRRRLRACPRLQPPRLGASAGRAAPTGQRPGSNPGTDSNALLPGCLTSLPRPAETGTRCARLGARQLRAPPPTRA